MTLRLIGRALAASTTPSPGPRTRCFDATTPTRWSSSASAAGDRMLELLGYRFRIVADLEVGDIAAVDRDIASFSRLAAELRQPLVRWYVPLFHGMRALLAGDLDRRRGTTQRSPRRQRRPAAATPRCSRRRCARHRRGDGAEPPTRRPRRHLRSGRRGVGDVRRGDGDGRWLTGDATATASFCNSMPATASRGSARTASTSRHSSCSAGSPRGWATGPRWRWSTSSSSRTAGLWAVDGIGACCWGPVDLELGRLALALDRRRDARVHLADARAALEAASAPLLLDDLDGARAAARPRRRARSRRAAPGIADRANVFRRDGQFWTLTYRGRTVRMKDAKGLHDLARLLATPGREVHVLDLAGTRADPIGDGLAAAGDAGELLDTRARAEYRRRLAELDDELADADRSGDAGRAETGPGGAGLHRRRDRGRARARRPSPPRRRSRRASPQGGDRPGAAHDRPHRAPSTRTWPAISPPRCGPVPTAPTSPRLPTDWDGVARRDLASPHRDVAPRWATNHPEEHTMTVTELPRPTSRRRSVRTPSVSSAPAWPRSRRSRSASAASSASTSILPTTAA